MPLPLWKVLFKFSQTQPTATVTCEECYMILDYLADQAARGADWPGLLRTAREHMARCPGCREHYLQRLRELETRLEQKDPTSDV
jgi:hypothetical protein